MNETIMFFIEAIIIPVLVGSLAFFALNFFAAPSLRYREITQNIRSNLLFYQGVLEEPTGKFDRNLEVSNIIRRDAIELSTVNTYITEIFPLRFLFGIPDRNKVDEAFKALISISTQAIEQEKDRVHAKADTLKYFKIVQDNLKLVVDGEIDKRLKMAEKACFSPR